MSNFMTTRCPACSCNIDYCKCPTPVASLACGKRVDGDDVRATSVARVDVDCGSLPLTPSIPQATAKPESKATGDAAAYVAPGSLPYETLFKIADERLELLLGCRRAHRSYQAVCEQQIAEKNAEIEGLRKLIGQCVEYVDCLASEMESQSRTLHSKEACDVRAFEKLLRSVSSQSSTTQAPEAAPHVTTTPTTLPNL